MNSKSLKDSIIWPLLTSQQRYFIEAWATFDAAPTIAEMARHYDEAGSPFGKIRKALERIRKQLIHAGVFSDQVCGRAGGGRGANNLLTADFANAAVFDAIAQKLRKANGQAIASEKPNGQAISRQKGNGQARVVHLPPQGVDHLPSRDDPIRPCENATFISNAGTLLNRNYLSDQRNLPIVATDAIPTSLLSNTTDHSSGSVVVAAPPGTACPFAYQQSPDTYYQDRIEVLSDQNEPPPALVDWYECAFEEIAIADDINAVRVLAIDPSVRNSGWALLGPGPSHILSGIDYGCDGPIVPERVAFIADLVRQRIWSTQPTFVVIECPDHPPESGGKRLRDYKTLCEAYRAILRIIVDSRVPYVEIDASTLTRGRSNVDKHTIKTENLAFFRKMVGCPTFQPRCRIWTGASSTNYISQSACCSPESRGDAGDLLSARL